MGPTGLDVALEPLLVLGAKTLRNDEPRQFAAHRFVRGPAEHGRGASVPAGHDALAVHEDVRIERVVDDQAGAGLTFENGLLVAVVLNRNSRQVRRVGGQVQESRRGPARLRVVQRERTENGLVGAHDGHGPTRAEAGGQCGVPVVDPPRVGGNVGHDYGLLQERGGAARSLVRADRLTVDRADPGLGEAGSGGVPDPRAILDEQDRRQHAIGLRLERTRQRVECLTQRHTRGDQLQNMCLARPQSRQIRRLARRRARAFALSRGSRPALGHGTILSCSHAQRERLTVGQASPDPFDEVSDRYPDLDMFRFEICFEVRRVDAAWGVRSFEVRPDRTPPLDHRSGQRARTTEHEILAWRDVDHLKWRRNRI